MPNYLYNGVELPQLPEWDKTVYPYAYMDINIRLSDKVANQADVVFCTAPISVTTFISTYKGSANTAVSGLAYRWEIGDTEFKRYESKDFSLEAGETTGWIYIDWANTDLINTKDNTIVCAASYPIDAETGEEIHDYEIGVEPEAPVLSWNGKDIYKVVNGQWVKHDAVRSNGSEWVKQDSYS